MATTEEIRADLAEIVNEVAGVDADDVQLDKAFVDDLDVDPCPWSRSSSRAREVRRLHPGRRG